jgi:hypothetical protein
MNERENERENEGNYILLVAGKGAGDSGNCSRHIARSLDRLR